MNDDFNFVDKSASTIELELSKLISFQSELDAMVKNKESDTNFVKEAILLKQSLKKAILRRRIQLNLIALKKHIQLIEALKEKLYLFNKLYSRFLEEKLRIDELSSLFAEEATKLPSSDELKEKLYEIRARYLELLNNDLEEQEDAGKT